MTTTTTTSIGSSRVLGKHRRPWRRRKILFVCCCIVASILSIHYYLPVVVADRDADVASSGGTTAEVEDSECEIIEGDNTKDEEQSCTNPKSSEIKNGGGGGGENDEDDDEDDDDDDTSNKFDFSIAASSISKFLNERVFGQKDDAATLQDHPQESFMSILDGAKDRIGGKKDSEDYDGNSNINNNDDAGGDNKLFDSFNSKSSDEEENNNPFKSFMQVLSEFRIPGVTFPNNVTTLSGDDDDEKDDRDKIEETMSVSSDTADRIVTLLERAAVIGQQEEVIDGLEYLNRLKEYHNRVVEQINDNFHDVLEGTDMLTAVAMVYYAAFVESKRTPTWKRQMHRFYETLSKEELIQLHEGLYLSALAYSDTVEDIEKGLQAFHGGSFELIHGSTRSLPNLPASFLLIHKQLAPLEQPSLKDFFFPDIKKESEVLVVLVVRGTKDIADALADGLLAPHSYMNGYVHEGLLHAGQGIAEKYLPMLKDIHEQSGRDKLKLLIMGHSLGAGAAAIAAMEFHEHHSSWMKVEALGFGTPSLLSPELSMSTKDYITTVVCDSDIVPRMSGSSMANAILDLVEYDWTDDAVRDIEFTLDRARDVFKGPMMSLFPDNDSVMQWVTDWLDKEVRPKLKSQSKRERLPSVLIPPGACVHVFRDGYGFTASLTPCDFFSTVEVSRNIVDDHLVATGYHRALLSAAQDSDRDYNFQFDNDVAQFV